MPGGDVVSDDLTNEVDGLFHLLGCVGLHVLRFSPWKTARILPRQGAGQICFG
jgi:hypothetical protein